MAKPSFINLWNAYPTRGFDDSGYASKAVWFWELT